MPVQSALFAVKEIREQMSRPLRFLYLALAIGLILYFFFVYPTASPRAWSVCDVP